MEGQQQEQQGQCAICLGEVNAPIWGLVTVNSPCTHFLCKSCLRQYVLSYNNGLAKPDYSIIPCPCPGCPTNYSTHDLLPLVLNDSEMHSWWRKAIMANQMDSVGYCPYPDCKAVFELFPEPELRSKPIKLWQLLKIKWRSSAGKEPSCYAACYACQRDICLDCELPAHNDGGKCSKQRQGGWRRQTPETFSELYQVAQREGWARCPHCMHVVIKAEGCNLISCLCGKNFCYRCCTPSTGHACSRRCHLLSKARVTLIRNATLEQTEHCG
ncbi:hypothetical protein BX666DRAFT_1626580 [Dichotomocladium elegans]|nr:hypothetical protein BX666DRAFT_1626580 [Dichotomocladium elegans]